MAYAHQSLVGSRCVRETLATRLLASFVGWRLAEDIEVVGQLAHTLYILGKTGGMAHIVEIGVAHDVGVSLAHGTQRIREVEEPKGRDGVALQRIEAGQVIGYACKSKAIDHFLGLLPIALKHTRHRVGHGYATFW